jgi:hypothetical protein
MQRSRYGGELGDLARRETKKRLEDLPPLAAIKNGLPLERQAEGTWNLKLSLNCEAGTLDSQEAQTSRENH